MVWLGKRVARAVVDASHVSSARRALSRDIRQPHGKFLASVEIFFSYVPTVSRAFHYETFKARMALPPSHADFPKPILLHAMCAASARYTAQVYTVNPEKQPWINASQHMDQPAFEEDFGVRHSLYAIKHVHSNLARGVDIYETCQALLLLANHYHIYARWVEGWTVIGMLGRLIVPLGLTGTRSQLLAPTGKVVEREERKLLTWMAVLYDIQSSTSGNWPGCIHFDEMVSRVNLGRGCELTLPRRISPCPRAWRALIRRSCMVSQRRSRRSTVRICSPGIRYRTACRCT